MPGTSLLVSSRAQTPSQVGGFRAWALCSRSTPSILLSSFCAAPRGCILGGSFRSIWLNRFLLQPVPLCFSKVHFYSVSFAISCYACSMPSGLQCIFLKHTLQLFSDPSFPPVHHSHLPSIQTCHSARGSAASWQPWALCLWGPPQLPASASRLADRKWWWMGC